MNVQVSTKLRGVNYKGRSVFQSLIVEGKKENL